MNHQQSTDKQANISLLINSAYYFLEHALINIENRKFRLLVVNNRRKLIDKTFKNMRGARISFSKLFAKRRYESTKAEWSPLYQPESPWLEKMLKIPLTSNKQQVIRKEESNAENRKGAGKTQAH